MSSRPPIQWQRHKHTSSVPGNSKSKLPVPVALEYVLALFMLPGYPVAHLNFRGCSLMTSKMDLVEIHAPSETDENL